MSSALWSSVRRVAIVRPPFPARPMRASWSAALFWLALIAGVTAMQPAAFAQQVVGEFEIDGNTSDDSIANPPYDWANATPANGFVVPKRKSGDIVISFDQGGQNNLVPQVLQWNGNELTGTFTDITPTLGPTDFGSFLSTDTLFGEAALNISLIDDFGLCGINTFKKFWAKTRASEGITSVLKDRTLQFDVHVCDDANACTTDQCDINAPATNFCSFTPISCDDGFSCTTDTCDGNGGCIHTPVDSVCDDGNVCTNDACNPS